MNGAQTDQLPKHLDAVALSDPAQPMVVAVVIDTDADAFIVLRELVDGRVYLGCLLDAGKRLHRYLELWVQQSSSLLKAAHISPEALQNARLDEKWQGLAQAWAATGGDDVIVTGWEKEFDRVIEVDTAARIMRQVGSEDEKPLYLCRDEAALRAAGLPSYSATLHRYLTDGKLFVSTAPNSPRPENEAVMTSLSPSHKKWLVLNPQGGPILVRTLHPLGLASYCDFLAGTPKELCLGVVKAAQPWLHPANAAIDSPWLLGSYGRPGRMIEVLYLKLALLKDAFVEVRAMVEQLGKPLLNLSADSFRLAVDPSGSALPGRWATRAVLSVASEAISLPVPGLDRGCFVASRSQGEGAYRASAMRGADSGVGVLRIRRVTPSQNRYFILEGTLVAPALAEPRKTDLVWLRLSISGRQYDLWGRASAGDTTSSGEYRFISFEHPATEKEIDIIGGAEDFSAPDVAYSIIPSLSSPCDLYSLGVLAARLLLVNSDHPLAIAMDELKSIASAIASNENHGQPLEQILEQFFQENPDLSKLMGAQHLMHDPKAHAESAAVIPLQLWAGVISLILRCIPGAVSQSFARDGGDAPPEALHRVFDAPIEELSSLLTRARNLISVDSFSVNEISEVISRRAQNAARLLASAAVSQPPAAPSMIRQSPQATMFGNNSNEHPNQRSASGAVGWIP